MLKKHELEGLEKHYGCLAKAGDDEPLFILRAQDVLAPRCVELWASLLEVAAVENGTLAERQGKIDEARRTATMMKQWPLRKLPD